MMGNDRLIYDRALFTIAAAWNIASAFMLLFNPDFLLDIHRIDDNNARLLVRSFSSSVATWGIGYALIAYNRKRFRDFAWLGVISKSIYFTVNAVAYARNTVSFEAFFPGLLDLIFAGLFMEFLLRTRKRGD